MESEIPHLPRWFSAPTMWLPGVQHAPVPQRDEPLGAVPVLAGLGTRSAASIWEQMGGFTPFPGV